MSQARVSFGQCQHGTLAKFEAFCVMFHMGMCVWSPRTPFVKGVITPKIRP
jgi:hypothetical protein